MTLDTVIVIASIMAATVSLVVTLVVVVKGRRNIRLRITEEQRTNQRRGLILLIGPQKGASPSTIEYHLPVLQHCWLIGTHQSLITAEQLAHSYPSVVCHWGEGPYLVNPDEITSTYKSVSHILEIERQKAGIEISEVIADITGGLKPMTAGLTLACIDHKCNMQYMKAPRDASGIIVPGGTPVPIKIDVAF